MNSLTKVITGGIGAAAIMAVLCYGHQAQANETWAEVHIGSKHSEDTYREAGHTKEFNETNLGLGVMHGINPHVEIGAGGYNNSYERTSLYVGGDLHTDTRQFMRLGVSVGLISGYEETDIMVLPNATFTNGNVRLKFGFIPGEVQVVTVTAGFRF